LGILKIPQDFLYKTYLSPEKLISLFPPFVALSRLLFYIVSVSHFRINTFILMVRPLAAAEQAQ